MSNPRSRMPGSPGAAAPRRTDIAEPAELRLSHSTTRPLSFMGAYELPPVGPGGDVQSGPKGDRLVTYPWGFEESLVVPGSPRSYLVRYCFPITDVDYLYAYCIGDALDGPFAVMTSRDIGDAATAAVAQHWPTTMALLLNSNLWDPSTPALLRVVTDEARWAVAVSFTTLTPEAVLRPPEELIRDLMAATMDALDEVKDGFLALPGAMDILSGPDRLDRRVAGFNASVGAAKNAVQALDLLSKFLR